MFQQIIIFNGGYRKRVGSGESDIPLSKFRRLEQGSNEIKGVSIFVHVQSCVGLLWFEKPHQATRDLG